MAQFTIRVIPTEAAESVTEQVADIARELGYQVSVRPTRVPHWKPWRDGVTSLFRGEKFNPELLVEHRGKFAVVVIRARVLFHAIIQTRRMADQARAEALLCLPDKGFAEVPGSGWEVAEKINVRLCPLSAVGETLREMLG